MFLISLPFTNQFLDFDAQGVRRLGAAAVDMCHVALGIVEAYWEYRLKPWDMAAGVLVSSTLSTITLKA
jgi:fructose-1,6-bisphosphatase/inositol monophosphatase family enzyme